MALAGTEATLMSVDLDDATRLTAAAVVTQHVEGYDLLLVLSRLGYKLKNPPVFDLGAPVKRCRNDHPQQGENLGRKTNGTNYCVPCADARAASKRIRERKTPR